MFLGLQMLRLFVITGIQNQEAPEQGMLEPRCFTTPDLHNIRPSMASY